MQPPIPPKNNRQIHLNIPADMNAIYANGVLISQAPSEIFLDFMQMLPNTPQAKVQGRVVMTPINAKMFLQALQKNIENYEKKHGEIQLPPQPATLADQLFGGIAKPEQDPENESGPQTNE